MRNRRYLGGAPAAESLVEGNGNMHVPGNYRREYAYLGSWVVAADQARGSKELHVVFASPGTVLVKEVFQAATAPMTTQATEWVYVGGYPSLRPEGVR